jgi:glucans biosynthesis protein
MFTLTPGSAPLIELNCVLMNGDTPVSETWLYRWTP